VSSCRNRFVGTVAASAQRSYLKTLSEEAHEPFDENLTKAEASKWIEELQQITGRGVEKGEQSRSGDKSN
jgi:hypothetical protein